MNKEMERIPYWAGIGAHNIYDDASGYVPAIGTLGYFGDSADSIREKLISHAKPSELKHVDSANFDERYSSNDNPNARKFKYFMPVNDVYKVYGFIPGSWDGNHFHYGIFWFDEDRIEEGNAARLLIEEVA